MNTWALARVPTLDLPTLERIAEKEVTISPCFESDRHLAAAFALFRRASEELLLFGSFISAKYARTGRFFMSSF